MNDNPTAEKLVEAGCLGLRLEDPITLASGISSPVYMDVRQLIAKPDIWAKAIQQLCCEAESLSPEVISEVAVGGLSHSTAVALELSLPTCYVRLPQKPHGRNQTIEGVAVSGRRVVLIEDVVTTGGSSLTAAEVLRSQQANVVGCITIASYGLPMAVEAFRHANVPLIALTELADVLFAADQRGAFQASDIKAARQWHAELRC